MQIKKNHIIFLLPAILVCIFFCPRIFGQLEQKVSEKLCVTLSKNISLFHILVMISPYGEEKKDIFPHPIAQKARDYFKEFKDHPAIDTTHRIFNFSWYFLFNNVAFYFADFPEMKLYEEIELPPEFKARKNMITQYIEQVKDFYKASEFEAFWKIHNKDLESVIEECKRNIPEVSLPELMETFFGTQAECFYFVPCPFMQNSATHVEVKHKQGGLTYYYIAGGNTFLERFNNISTAFHEFSHSFIEPISAKYFNQIKKLSYLYKPLQNSLTRLGYKNWDRGFNEHIVRAAQLHLLRKALGEEARERVILSERRLGFKLIDNFYGFFDEYDRNREKYKNLESFYPEVLKRLSEIKVEEYRRPSYMGFYPESIENKVFVKDVVLDSAFSKAGIKKGDILFSIENVLIDSDDSFNKTKEKFWNQAKEGDSVKIVIIREDKKIELDVPVPFVTDFRYKHEEY